MFSHHKFLLETSTFAILLILAGLVLNVVVLQERQDNRSKAAETTTTASCPTIPTNTGRVTASITLSGGTYMVWSRMMIPNTTANAYYLQIDNGCAIKVGGSTSIPANTWQWINYKDGSTANKTTVNLAAGSHVVNIIGIGSGVNLDKLIFSTDLACVPTGLGTSCGTTVAPQSNFGSTLLDITIALHGLGQGGDSANPASHGTMNPRRSERTVTVEILNQQNAVILTKQGVVKYDGATGTFKGTIDFGTALTTGTYLVRVDTNQYLRLLVPGIQKITAGTTNKLPQVTLVTGDVADDNLLNIADFNLLMGCYTDLTQASNCPTGNKEKADINDDGSVNQLDYNLFLREINSRRGN